MCLHVHIDTCSCVYNITVLRGAAFSSERSWEEVLSTVRKVVKIVAEQVDKYPAKHTGCSICRPTYTGRTPQNVHFQVHMCTAHGHPVSTFTHLSRVS